MYITTCSQLVAAKHEDASFSKRYGPPRIHATEHTLHTLHTLHNYRTVPTSLLPTLVREYFEKYSDKISIDL